MAFFQVVAVDLDGTLTSGGRVSAEALDAIDQVRRNGLVVVLVTGRITAELEAEFGQVADHVDALVLENGAVMVIDETAQALSAPVDRALDDALAARGVPYRRGEVLLAVDVTKGTGLGAVLAEMNLSAHNMLAVGDAEKTCRCSASLRSASL